MNNVNKTLYIPLYGKAYVSRKGIILSDKWAEKIWQKEVVALKGKSKSKWLAYYMAMRAAIYDEWTRARLSANPKAVVLHIGCGMDSRCERVNSSSLWYDVDFPEVINERRKYFTESDSYRMLPCDIRLGEWRENTPKGADAIVILEGVSMYLKPEELNSFLSSLGEHFGSVKILMDCYTEKAAKISKYKNPINDVGVREVWGYDHPESLATDSGLIFLKEYDMTPEKYINELSRMERRIFRRIYAGKISKALYRMYEFSK